MMEIIFLLIVDVYPVRLGQSEGTISQFHGR